MMKKLACLFGVLFTLTVLACACTHKKPDPAVTSEPTETQATSVDLPGLPELTEGVFISELFSYSGVYVEDGGGDACEGICAVRLTNVSDVSYQYLRFALKTTGGDCMFSATTLLPGADMTVLCEEKTPFSDGNILSAELLNAAVFASPPSVHDDVLRVTYTDGFISVKNLSDATLSNLYVYYKDTDDAGYLGGITYRASFGSLEPGQIRQTGAPHMRRDTCVVVFVTYDA